MALHDSDEGSIDPVADAMLRKMDIGDAKMNGYTQAELEKWAAHESGRLTKQPEIVPQEPQTGVETAQAEIRKDVGEAFGS